MNPSPVAPLAVDETTLAEALSVSVHYLRKDRRTKRLLPYFKLGDRVLYNLDRVRQALDSYEEGGANLKAPPGKPGRKPSASSQENTAARRTRASGKPDAGNIRLA